MLQANRSSEMVKKTLTSEAFFPRQGASCFQALKTF